MKIKSKRVDYAFPWGKIYDGASFTTAKRHSNDDDSSSYSSDSGGELKLFNFRDALT